MNTGDRALSLAERARIRLAAWWYGVWLEHRGVPSRERRALTAELRANLVAATQHTPARDAVRDLGGLRVLAAATAATSGLRPRWQAGAIAAAVTWSAIVVIEMLVALNFVDGVRAGSGGATTGALFGFPGSSITYEPAGDGLSVALSFGWLAPACAVLVFVIVARPWRSLRRSAATAADVTR